MGGYGSTRWAGHERQRTTAEAGPLPVRSFAGALTAARAVLARSETSEASSVPLADLPTWWLGRDWAGDGAHVLMRTNAAGLPLVSLDVVAVPQPFGGARWWWVCEGCEQRRATLYLPPVPGASGLGEAWRAAIARAGSDDAARALLRVRCRRCLGLAYRSWQLTPTDRLAHRAQVLAYRTGPVEGHVTGGDFPRRRPGAHRRRYERQTEQLCAVLAAWEEAWCAAGMRAFRVRKLRRCIGNP